MPHLRYALRMLLKQPAFTAIAVFTLALGIGANSAIFSVVNAVLLRPLPFEKPDQLVVLSNYDRRVGLTNSIDTVSYPNFADWRAQNRVFSGVAVYTQNGLTLTDGVEATHLQGLAVTADLFPILGIQPQLGRHFLAAEDEPGNHVVIISDQLWRDRYGHDPKIVGQSIMLDGASYQVVGVMPPGFQFPIDPVPVDVWTSIAEFRRKVDAGPPVTEMRGSDFMRCLARLKGGVTLAQAQANLGVIGAALSKQYPDTNSYAGVEAVPFLTALVGPVRPALLMLVATAGCVLLVACVNVANLLVARSVARQKEICIRSALGAQRRDIILQLLTESALLGLAGGLIGLLIAVWGVDSLAYLLPRNLPRASQISPDARVLAFTGIISLLVGCLAGLLPAWRASHPNLTSSLNEGSRGSSESGRGLRIRGALVVIEILLALVLLSAAGLLTRSFLRLREVNPGFDGHHVMTARLALPSASYGNSLEAASFYGRLLERISALPGVDSAAAAWWLPLSGSEIAFDFDDVQHPLPEAERPITQANSITPDYFKVLRIPLVRGRTFTDRDDDKAPPVAIVNEKFVRQFFGGGDPIGRRIVPGVAMDGRRQVVREIVGVVGDTRALTLGAQAKPELYLPNRQLRLPSMNLVVRANIEPRAILPTLRDTIASLDKNVPLYRPRPMEEFLASSAAQPRFTSLLVSLFSAVTLLLAGAGIFGVMSYSVTQRQQEIGIRLALGAQRFDVLRMIVGQGMRLVALGLGAGLIVTFALSRLLRGLLYNISATDLSTLFIVSLMLALVAFLACWLPARRASGINPIEALREG